MITNNKNHLWTNCVIELLSICSRADLRKCLFLNYKPCMARSTIINMNPVEFKYYPLMISLNKCTGSCNVLFVPKETKDINVKAFNMITNIKLKQ